MTTTPEPRVLARIQSTGRQIFGPVDASPGTARRRILLARSAVAYGGLVVTLVQIVVWLMIAVLTTSIDSPWWLFTAVPAALAVGVLTLLDRWRTATSAQPATR